MPPWYYINSIGSRVSTSVGINLCETKGPMSVCMACSVADQYGCKYREDATNADHCLYWRSTIGGACDNPYAQRRIDPPKKE